MAETRRTGPLLEVEDLRVAFRTGDGLRDALDPKDR